MRTAGRGLMAAALFVLGTFALAEVALSAGRRLVAVKQDGFMRLSDDASKSALFNAGTMAPGESVSNCLVVGYEGSAPAKSVRLSSQVAGTGLSRYLDMRVDLGTGGRYGNCTGFVGTPVYAGTLADFASRHASVTEGMDIGLGAMGKWRRTFRFTLTLRDAPAAQGLTASARFTWDARDLAVVARPAPSGPAVDDGLQESQVAAKPGWVVESSQRGGVGGLLRTLASAIGSGLSAAAAVAIVAGEKAAFPAALAFGAGAFLIIQDWIDRRDPKLARAPVRNEPDLPFRAISDDGVRREGAT